MVKYGDLNSQHFFPEALGQELSDELSDKVISHRNYFRRFFVNRYLEALSTLFFYNIEKPFNKSAVEMALRQGYGVVFGKNAFGGNSVLGFTKDQYLYDNPQSFLYYKRLSYKDINFTVPEEIRPPEKETIEITFYDDAKTGNFIVFHNKPVWLVNDYKVINYYADELAEIVASRFSLILQSKAMTVITTEVGDETANQMIKDIYNGNPFVKMSNKFDVEDNIIEINNSQLANNLQQLKTEYQNKIAELNAEFGINVLSVDKESGVSESESNGNLGYVKMNGNIWLEARQQALDLYNARFGKNYKVRFDDQTSDVLAKSKEKEDNNKNEGTDEKNNELDR